MLIKNKIRDSSVCEESALRSGRKISRSWMSGGNKSFVSLLYCSKSCTSLHFKTLKSHTKTLKMRPYVLRSPLKPSSGDPWLYFATLLNWNVDLHLL